MLLKNLTLCLTLTLAIAMPAYASSLRRANHSVLDTDSWSFIATHVSSAGPTNQVFVNDIPMGPFATEAACVAVMQAYLPEQPANTVDYTSWNGIFKTSCCIDNTTGAKDCGPN